MASSATSSSGLCRYRHVFGREREGVHSVRLFDVAILDVLGTVIGAWLIARWLRMRFLFVLVTLLLLGILMHRMFCVQTTWNTWIFGAGGGFGGLAQSTTKNDKDL